MKQIKNLSRWVGKAHIFQTDPKKLQEMLELRKQGWSYPKLAAKYQCDFSSIRFQVKKHSIKIPNGTKTLTFPRLIKQQTRIPRSMNETPLQDFYIENGEKISSGHDYKWYVAKEKERKEKHELEK